jgi:hypothetical protein
MEFTPHLTWQSRLDQGVKLLNCIRLRWQYWLSRLSKIYFDFSQLLQTIFITVISNRPRHFDPHLHDSPQVTNKQPAFQFVVRSRTHEKRLLASSCPSVCQHISARLPLYEFLLNFLPSFFFFFNFRTVNFVLCLGITNKCIISYQFIISFSCSYMFRQLCAILGELVYTFSVTCQLGFW